MAKKKGMGQLCFVKNLPLGSMSEMPKEITGSHFTTINVAFQLNKCVVT
jgi:hypothetical protein